MELRGESVEKGPVVVFWSHGEQRRVVLPLGWAEAKALWKRLLGRFRGGRRHYVDAQSQLTRLLEVDLPLTARFGRHTIGLVRPYQLGELGGDEPVMICKERGSTGREPCVPILAEDVDAARSLVRRLQARGVSVSDWRCYEGERLDIPVEKLFRSTADGRIFGRTVLEDELVACFGSSGRARQEFPPLPSYTPIELPDHEIPDLPAPAAGLMRSLE